MIITKQIETPVGTMRLGATDDGICLFDFAYRRLIDPIMKRIEKGLNDTFEEGEHHHFKMLEKQLNEYGMAYCKFLMEKQGLTSSSLFSWVMKKQ
jgi:hypothetical protein